MINLPKKPCFAIGWNKVDICVGRCWEIAADPPIPDMDIRSAVFFAVFECDNPNSWYSNLSKSQFSHWNVHLSWWNLHFSRENPHFSGSNLHLSRWNRHFSMVKNGVKSPLKAIPDPCETPAFRTVSWFRAKRTESEESAELGNCTAPLRPDELVASHRWEIHMSSVQISWA